MTVIDILKTYDPSRLIVITPARRIVSVEEAIKIYEWFGSEAEVAEDQNGIH